MQTLTSITSQDLTNGSKDFPLNGSGPINVVEYFTFTPTATGGTVVVQTSPDNGNTWDDLPTGGSITASLASAASRIKPSGRGLANKIRFTFTGITGATSYTAMISQGDA